MFRESSLNNWTKMSHFSVKSEVLREGATLLIYVILLFGLILMLFLTFS